MYTIKQTGGFLARGCEAPIRQVQGKTGMFNICPECGEYSEEKAIDPSGPFAICSFCGHAQRFERLPLFIVTGASGSGKSTVGLALVRRLRECVVMETDILWRPEFDTPQDGYRTYRT